MSKFKKYQEQCNALCDLDEEEMEDDPIANAFEDDWGIKIPYSFIGEIQE